MGSPLLVISFCEVTSPCFPNKDNNNFLWLKMVRWVTKCSELSTFIFKPPEYEKTKGKLPGVHQVV